MIFLILHNIRSLHNVGSIFRTADGAGVKKIFLTGYTPAPIDIFGKTRKEIQKTALGAEKTVKWEKHKNISDLIIKLKNYRHQVSIVGVEQSKDSVGYKGFKYKYPLALILGNEIRGLSRQVLKKCDSVIEIPMHGKKESLNVAVVAGIVLFEMI